MDLVTPLTQVAGHQFAGFAFLETQFGVLMYVLANGGEIGLHCHDFRDKAKGLLGHAGISVEWGG
ncbi:hypothetical protein D3C76_1591200 [compost metagenome]